MPFRVPIIEVDMYSKHEVDRLVTGSVGATGTSGRAHVTVQSTDWTADTALYPGAPDLGTLYYADLDHNLRSPLAVAIAHVGDSDDVKYIVQFQQLQSASTTRVWLAFPPQYATTFLVIG